MDFKPFFNSLTRELILFGLAMIGVGGLAVAALYLGFHYL